MLHIYTNDNQKTILKQGYKSSNTIIREKQKFKFALNAKNLIE